MVQVPLNPENFDKVNYIIKAWARPCQAPWYIYVEALKPALLTAFITLATFGWDDVARGCFRPRGLGRRTGKRGTRGKGGRGLRGIPELGDLLGKNLPGADEIKGERWSNLGKTLWRIDSLTQLGLFFWLVADVTEDLAFNFTSVLYETVWCQASTLGRFSYRTEDDQVIVGGSWQRLHFEIEDYEHPPPSWLFISGLSGPGCLAAAGVTLKKHPSFPAPTETSIRFAERFTQTVYHEDGPTPADPDGTVRIPLSGDIPPNIRFQVQVKHDAPFALVDAAFVTGMENEDQ